MTVVRGVRVEPNQPLIANMAPGDIEPEFIRVTEKLRLKESEDKGYPRESEIFPEKFLWVGVTHQLKISAHRSLPCFSWL
jgi:hypothetical protein